MTVEPGSEEERPGRRNPGRVLGVLLAALALLVIVVTTRPDSSTVVTTTVPPFTSPTPPPLAAPTTAGPPPPELAAVWTTLPAPPFGDDLIWHAGNQVAVWTGDELIVWGGIPASPVDDVDTEGAAFDHTSKSWRILAPAPGGVRSSPTAVWTGRGMLIWGGIQRGEILNDGLRYTPGSDTWAAIPPAPILPRLGATAVWTGEEMVIFGGRTSGERGPLPEAAAFNPSSNQWRRIADLPEHDSAVMASEIAAVWTGEELVAVGGALVDQTVVYLPEEDRWEAVDSPLGARVRHTVSWTGAEVVVTGGSSRESNGPQVAAWNPDTGVWRELADMPGTERSGHLATWTGDGLLVWGGSPVRALTDFSERIGQGLWYDLHNDTWFSVEGPTLPYPTARLNSQLIWAGEVGFVWQPPQVSILELTHQEG